MNAFTDREMTCYYARVLADDIVNAIDVLCDMYTHSKLAPDDLELEKSVVQEEIRKYEDSPEDHIHDLHARMRWGNHPLGKPIIGTHESVGSFKREDLVSYMSNRYVGGKTIVAVAGNVDPNAVRDLAERHLDSLANDFELPNEPPPTSEPGEHLISKDVEQVHFCIGGDGVNVYDERKYAMSVLDAVLGGSMSSRLFQEIREKRGLAYAIGSYVAPYREAGAFTIYGGTSPKTFGEVRDVIGREVGKLRVADVSQEEVDRTKRMLKGNLVLGLESMSARMTRIARNEMLFGRDIPVEETLEKIGAVQPGDVRELAVEFLEPEALTTTAIGPFK
jgi:predicted Zn-dependent peptidase